MKNAQPFEIGLIISFVRAFHQSIGIEQIIGIAFGAKPPFFIMQSQSKQLRKYDPHPIVVRPVFTELPPLHPIDNFAG